MRKRRLLLAWVLFFPAWFFVFVWGFFLAWPDASWLGRALTAYTLGATSAAFSLAIASVRCGTEGDTP